MSNGMSLRQALGGLLIMLVCFIWNAPFLIL